MAAECFIPRLDTNYYTAAVFKINSVGMYFLDRLQPVFSFKEYRPPRTDGSCRNGFVRRCLVRSFLPGLNRETAVYVIPCVKGK